MLKVGVFADTVGGFRVKVQPFAVDGGVYETEVRVVIRTVAVGSEKVMRDWLVVAVNFAQFATVVSHGGQTHGIDHSRAVFDDGLNEEAPEFLSLAINHSQLKQNSH